MSSLPIHQGVWTDWSSNGQLLWTTRGSTAILCTNLIAFILGVFVLGACWSLIAFLFHRYGDRLAGSSKNDGLHRHHRLIWRNVADPFSATIELITVGFAWYRTEIPPDRLHGTRMSRTWILLRTLLAMLIPLALFGGFTAASVLTAKIALTGGNVLVKAHAKGQCGFLQYPNGSLLDQSVSTEVLLSYQAQVLHDTIAGRAYARSCYSRDFASTVSCSFFVRPDLPYSAYQQDKASGCPFGAAGDPFETTPCNTIRNEGAYVMYTALLDSDLDLGINARPEHRLTFQKTTTCSVINPVPYANSTTGFGTSPYNYTYQVYCLGPLVPLGSPNISGPCGVDTSTFFYTPAAIELNVGYQTNAVVYFANASSNQWQAYPEFRRLDGDTALVSITANSIQYTQPVYDPLFLATSAKDAGAGTGLSLVYQPYYTLNIIGCVDRYKICNPRFTSRCTPSSGIADLRRNYKALELNDHQTATAFRITAILQNTDTYSNTYATGDEALKASDKALYDISLALPYDQWITEVRGWFETGLAKMQSYSVQYAANTHIVGPYGSVKAPDVDSQLGKVFMDQCATQKIKSSDTEQNLSLTGIIIVAVVGGVLFFSGQLFHPAVLPLWRKHLRKRLFRRSQPQSRSTKYQRDYIADSKYHLYRMAVEDRGDPYRYKLRDDCATFTNNPSLPDAVERGPLISTGVTDEAIVYRDINTPLQTTATHSMASQANAQGQPPPMNQTGALLTAPSVPTRQSGSQQGLLQTSNVAAGSTPATSSRGSSPSTATSHNSNTTGTAASSGPTISAGTSAGNTAGVPAQPVVANNASVSGQPATVSGTTAGP